MKLEERISQYYDRLNPNDRIIWQYISTHMGECCNISIEELALRCNVSRSTVMMSDYNLFLNYNKHRLSSMLYFEQTAEMFLVMQILFIKYISYINI